jgi:6-phosphogluconate dehydrogenase
VSKIYNATGDVDFLDFIINDTDKLLIDKQKGDADKTVVEEALDVAGACGKLIATVQEAMEDKKMTPSEKTCIEKSINRAQKELEDLRERIKE